ncbi:hypothetical protein [uncultured Bdellovibrio sp.]|uniref:hypothetical protein n=1 Tax=Bdellovibrio sp. HCB-162 TaxID=3394234 RepID=UPI0025F63127|nr:hypothetical protein [uncultured Bdellovibrio sp.]
MLYKLIGALIIVVAGTIAFLALQEEGNPLHALKKDKKAAEVCVQLTPAQQLAKMINDDFQALAQSGELPAQWGSIATVEFRMNSELARAILGKQRPHIQRVKDGKSYLELEVMDLPDEENPGVIIQASLFDIKSKNKIFEIGRTYTMNDLNKVAPPEKKVPAKAGAPAQGQQPPSQTAASGSNPQQPPTATNSNNQNQQQQQQTPPQSNSHAVPASGAAPAATAQGASTK